ncbi:MAG: hypothetical protein AAB874_04900, partial [Patescibacteria group bacterium]
SLDTLKEFPAIVLYNYRYRSKSTAFKLLEEYVKNGGHVFIETGSNSPEGESTNLPDFFDFNSTTRKVMESSWDLEIGSGTIIDGIETDQFGPPEYEGSGWKFSVAGDLSANANVLLKNYAQPILVEWQMGNGAVLWSGMNLPYHYVRFNKSVERKIFINFLSSSFALKEHVLPASKIEKMDPGNLRITPTEEAKAILLKQEYWPGWRASTKNQHLPIFSAGPTYFGFLYVPIKYAANNPVKISYNGTWEFFFQSLMTWGVSILLLAEFITNGFLSGKILPVVIKKITLTKNKWWEKDDLE